MTQRTLQPLISLEPAQLLERCRLLGLYEPLIADSGVEVDYGIDLDRLLMLRIEQWYFKYMASTPVEQLPAVDIADEVEVVTMSDGTALVELPSDVVRIVSVGLEGWLRQAVVIGDATSLQARVQRNPYARGSAGRPVALHQPDNTLLLFAPGQSAPVLSSLWVVRFPNPGNPFLFTPAMLADFDSHFDYRNITQ
ncbi:MAG: hypothetical protein NC111_01000 [Bacteroides sp.]|nr:hypothetical protein [Bacteroides sp.]MCM1413542.1 hypothetical protein [Bacteroides sp.]MCM1471096.1 hypothetical protein [Bacteroides sp.]